MYVCTPTLFKTHAYKISCIVFIYLYTRITDILQVICFSIIWDKQSKL